MTTAFDELMARRRKLQDLVAELQPAYDVMVESYPSRIGDLQRQADALAATFKPLVQQAVDAYASGDRAGAKRISNERKDLQAQCEALNAQVKAMRQEQIETLATLREARRELGDIKNQLKEYARRDKARDIAMSGFERAYGITEGVVREELNLLPARLLAFIAGVTYVHEVPPDFAVGRTGQKASHPEKAPIFLYINTESSDKVALERRYRKVIIHETGHVLFDWVINSRQRWQWGELYNQTLRDGRSFISSYASESLREDFGECFAVYLHEPVRLRMYDPVRYTFIDTIFREVNA